MIRVLHRLTTTRVKTAPKGLHADGGCLYLQSDGGSRKSWIFRYALGGREHQMGLGAVHTISLAEARQEATELRKVLYRGQDPLQQRKARRASQVIEAAKAVTFDKCAEDYIKAHQAGWKNSRHRDQWVTTLKMYASAVIGALPVQAVDTALVAKILEPIWLTKPETASRLRGRIEAVLNFAKSKGLRSGENPAAWKGNLDHVLPAKAKVRRTKHHPSMPYAEVPAFMVDLRKRESIAALALEFTILTAARSDEVISAEWREFDLNERVWTVPPERIKGGLEHRVPLADSAVAILERMKSIRRDDHVFGLGPTALLEELKRLRTGYTVHGFRSSFRTWGAEETNVQREVLEAALAHVIENEVEAAYQRGDLLAKRRDLMTAWAAFCS